MNLYIMQKDRKWKCPQISLILDFNSLKTHNNKKSKPFFVKVISGIYFPKSAKSEIIVRKGSSK